MLKGVVNPIPSVDGVTDGYVPTASGGTIVWAAQTGGGGGSTPAWGDITGTLSAQTDLQSALDAKQASDATLTAFAAYNTNGLITQTAADTFTGRTLTGGGGISVTNGNGVSGNPTLGVSALQSIWIPASAMWPSNSGGCGAVAQQTVGVNRPDIKYLPFDASSVESSEFTIAFPKGWNEGTITAQFYWTHPATATNFASIWALQGVALSNDDAHDTTWGTQQQVTDTGGTTYDVYVSDATSAITIAGTPAAGDICYFKLLRRASDGGDTLAVDAWLIGVKIFFTIDTLDDT